MVCAVWLPKVPRSCESAASTALYCTNALQVRSMATSEPIPTASEIIRRERQAKGRLGRQSDMRMRVHTR